jgi:ABC-2 type transport system ATP-binding protein
MIRVDSLSKSYGSFLAVDQLSFSVEKGEVVGFLGKNGAGKTTTMRLLTGALAIGSGRAEIGGHDVSLEPRAVKRMVGYLPETPPLYLDMSVTNYLKFCAQMRGVSAVKEAVEKVIPQTGLQDVTRRPIGNLSKGFRQRVGIAQALVHAPSVLILDEPVSGLDPAQRREIRELIQVLAAGDTTVLLSTHVLSEIEAICHRVLIIDEGRLISDNTLDALSQTHVRVMVQVARPTENLPVELAALEGVLQFTETGPGAYEMSVDRDIREAIGKLALPCGLIELRTPQALEEAFVRLTEGEG